MKRLAVLSPVLLALAACGGAGENAVAPTVNEAGVDTGLPIDEPVYSGDNLTMIDAAANDAAAQPLAPDTPAGETGNAVAANETQPAE